MKQTTRRTFLKSAAASAINFASFALSASSANNARPLIAAAPAVPSCIKYRRVTSRC